MRNARRERQARFDRLRRIPLLAGCGDGQLEQIDRLGAELDVRPGCRLTSEGSIARECFVVVAGRAIAHRGHRTIGTIDAGSVAGEMGLLLRTTRSATVLAASPMRLLVLSRPEFDELLRIAPHVADVVEEIAATRQAELAHTGAS